METECPRATPGSSSSTARSNPTLGQDIANSPATIRRIGTLEQVRSNIGLKPQAPTDNDHDLATVHRHSLLWPQIRLILREPFAEFFGVVIMVLFGDGSVAQVLLSAGEQTAPGKDGFGAYQSISWGYVLSSLAGENAKDKNVLLIHGSPIFEICDSESSIPCL